MRTIAILIAVLATARLTVVDAAGETLPRIGPAPEFTLTNQDGQ